MKFLTVLYYVNIILTSVYLQESLAICPESSFRKKPNTKTEPFKQPAFRPIPKEFDARKHWPRCTVIGKVWHQGNCASCWAFSTTQVMADRTCIATNASINRLFSAEDLLHCCRECTDNITLNGCEGGWPLSAYEFWNKYGVVTGGTGYEKDGCKPYSPSSYKYNAAKDKYKPRNCTKKCQKYYKENVTFYENDKYYGSLGYEIPGNVETMQLEILENGPISVMFYVYDNFRGYNNNTVYRTPGQRIEGTHSVKIVGWGVDPEEGPYWTAANTWGIDWGDKGYFRIARGSNFCDIEAHATAAKPIIIPNSASIFSTHIYILFLCLITSAIINEMLNFNPTLFKKII